MNNVLWVIYRDESQREMLAKVQDCLKQFRAKTGSQANRAGVPSSFSVEAQAILEKDGVQVVHNLPAWAKDEIWIGHEEAV